jgi:hypothetical protein
LVRFWEGVHHIIVQGIEGKEIFQDDWDREDLLARPGEVQQEGETRCFSFFIYPWFSP